jgi:hypothetical protein
MSQLVAMIVCIDDVNKPEEISELWRQPLPQMSLDNLKAAHYLDGLEEQVTEVGWALMRQLIVEQWRLTDQALVRAYQEQQRGTWVTADGYDELQVVGRFGVIQLPRQVCYNAEADCHVLPGNTALLPHNGQVTTRGLQEGVCLLPQDVPFATAQRLLGWMTRELEVISTTQVRRWVQHHGQLIRQAEQAEVQALLKHERLSDWQAHLAPLQPPRCPAAWELTLNEAVEQALAQPEPVVPVGVSASDWERVLQARREETAIERLRRLGPQLQPGEIVAATSDVGVRRPEKRRWLEIRTACVRTATGYRYLSGSAQAVLQHLYLLLLVCGGLTAKLTLLGDGARWIATFFKTQIARWPGSELILDWYHLGKKCYELTSLIARGRVAKKALLGQLLYHLWRGQLDEALALLEAYRPQAKDADSLEMLIKYLSDRRAYLPDYKARRARRQYIGSAHAEKANDLLVARRQKHQGMHWHEASSDGLAALRTLLLNGGWDLYWKEQQVLPLAVLKAT